MSTLALDSSLEALERALEELEALEAVYAGSFTAVHSEAALAAARSAVECGASRLGPGWAPPLLDIKLDLELALPGAGAGAGGGSGGATGSEALVVALRCSLPPGYPHMAAAIPSASVPGYEAS